MLNLYIVGQAHREDVQSIAARPGAHLVECVLLRAELVGTAAARQHVQALKLQMNAELMSTAAARHSALAADGSRCTRSWWTAAARPGAQSGLCC